MSGLSQIERQKLINEEYKIWKKNTPFLYDLVLSHALLWPSLTVQWYPDRVISEDGSHSIQHMLLGTHAADGSNHIFIVELRMPTEETQFDLRQYDDRRGELGGFGGLSNSKIRMHKKINHDGEVNRARYMPQRPSVLATKTISAEVYVFDTDAHPETPTSTACIPDIRLQGHTKEGYGLAWSPSRPGQLISASADTTVQMWDVQATQGPGSVVYAAASFHGHDSYVEDVAWSDREESIFCSVGHDCKILVWDARAPKDPAQRVVGHALEINSVSFNPFNSDIIVTGSSDETLKFWDRRAFSKELYTLRGHTGKVLQAQWAPFSEAILASAGRDHRVLVWDLSAIGTEQSPEDAMDGPNELLFIHGGHGSQVSDLAWNANEDWVIASVDADNILQIWQMAENIYAKGPHEEEERGREGEDAAEGVA